MLALLALPAAVLSACRLGYGAAAPGTSCARCDPGQHTVPGRSRCTACAPGRFNDAAMLVCARCPSGKYAGQRGARRCQRCDTWVRLRQAHPAPGCHARVPTPATPVSPYAG